MGKGFLDHAGPRRGEPKEIQEAKSSGGEESLPPGRGGKVGPKGRKNTKELWYTCEIHQHHEAKGERGGRKDQIEWKGFRDFRWPEETRHQRTLKNTKSPITPAQEAAAKEPPSLDFKTIQWDKRNETSLDLHNFSVSYRTPRGGGENSTSRKKERRWLRSRRGLWTKTIFFAPRRKKGRKCEHRTVGGEVRGGGVENSGNQRKTKVED